MNLRPLWTLLFAGLLLAPGLALAEPEAAVLGADGAVLQLHSGTYAELFPGDSELFADSDVLALDVRRGGNIERHLVPGTESTSAEHVASLLHENGSGLTYLLWEGILNDIHPVLYLTSWDGAAWGDVFEVTGSPFARKGDPRLVVTRDVVDSKGETKASERTVLHLTWWEETVDTIRWRYAPLVIDNGRQVDDRPVRELGRYLGAQDSGFAAPSVDSLGLLQPGRDSSTVVAGFVDQDRLGSVEVEVVPQVLSRLADAVAAEIAALGPGVSQDVALDAVRRAVFENGGDFYPTTLVFLAEEIANLLFDQLGADATASDYESIASGMGGHIIHIGMRVGTAGLDDGDASEILTVGGDGASHHLKISAVGSWSVPTAPAVAANVVPSLFISRDGGDALLAWPLRHRVIYRETTAEGGWTAERAVRLDADLDAATALEMLRARTYDR
ncbi:MAG: hypothetical protein AAGC60_15640 [Acidobacteriota bacterium]